MTARPPSTLSAPRVGLLAVIIAVATAWPRSAAADHPPDLSASDWSDRSALAFIYLPALGALGLRMWADPPARPVLFSDTEGGQPSRIGGEVPHYLVTAAAGTGLVAIASLGGTERWAHAKGLAQTWATTKLVTGLTKNIFGRRRPDADTTNPARDSRRSFISGHASESVSTATYMGLYVYQHGPQSKLGRVAIIGGLVAYGVFIPYSRARDNRHHVTDVVAGAAVGMSIAAAFFFAADHSVTGEHDAARVMSVRVPF